MGACAVQIGTHDRLQMLASEARRVVLAAAGQNVFNGRNTLLKHVGALADQLAALAEDCSCGTDASGRPELEVCTTPARAELGLRFVANRLGGLHLQLDSGLPGLHMHLLRHRRIGDVIERCGLLAARELAHHSSAETTGAVYGRHVNTAAVQLLRERADLDRAGCAA